MTVKNRLTIGRWSFPVIEAFWYIYAMQTILTPKNLKSKAWLIRKRPVIKVKVSEHKVICLHLNHRLRWSTRDNTNHSSIEPVLRSLHDPLKVTSSGNDYRKDMTKDDAQIQQMQITSASWLGMCLVNRLTMVCGICNKAIGPRIRDKIRDRYHIARMHVSKQDLDSTYGENKDLRKQRPKTDKTKTRKRIPENKDSVFSLSIMIKDVIKRELSVYKNRVHLLDSS